jgi:hypothetical protein
MVIPPCGIDTSHWILATSDIGSYANSSFSEFFPVSEVDGSVLHVLLLDSTSFYFMLLDSTSSLESLVISSSL